jgi:hypothetical protein
MKLRRAVGAVLVCTLTVASTGCSTAYMPRPSPRVQVIMKGGTPAYVREGKVYEGGIFGGDLDEAVRGNPEAESHARTYQNSMIGGFLATLAGGVSMGGGLVLFAADSAQTSSDRSSSRQMVAGTLVLGGLAAYVAGIVLLSTAQPHHWDAINVYNDGLPESSPYAPPRPPYYGPPSPYPPPGAVPAPSAQPPAPAPRAP